MTEISAEDLKLLDQAKAAKAQRAGRTGRVISWFFGLFCGLVIGAVVMMVLAGQEMKKERATYDTSLRNAMYVDFQVPDAGRPIGDKMDMFELLRNFGSTAVNNARMADWNGQQMGKCYRELQSLKTGSTAPAAFPAVQSIQSGPNPQLESAVVALYNGIRPGLGDAIKAMIDKQHPSQP
jgi:hypothetical protein